MVPMESVPLASPRNGAKGVDAAKPIGAASQVDPAGRAEAAETGCRARLSAGGGSRFRAANSSAQVDLRHGRPQYKEVEQPSPVPMAADPILFVAAKWLGLACGLLIVATVAGFVLRWGTRFRLVGVTSFTGLLAISCLAFSISYTPGVTISGAVVAPVVFDGGGDLLIAAAPRDLDPKAIEPTVIQVASNLHGGGRSSADGRVRVRLRSIETNADGTARPVVLAEAVRDLANGNVNLTP